MSFDIDENEDNALKILGDRYERLTVKIIKERYWDPITKKGRPITFFDVQDYEEFTNEDYDENCQTMTPNGNLIKDSTIIKDWLSSSTGGPYKDSEDEKGEKGDIYYYLEFEENERDSGENCIQIGWSDSTNMENNYMTLDACDRVDCWIKKESLIKNGP